jgi:hypothetical protein
MESAMTTHTAVQNIASMLAEMERRSHKNAHDARGLRDDFKEISDNGDAPPMMTSKYYAELVAITASNAAAILDLHHRMTEDAKVLNIDVPPAQETQGDDIGILSGGGR